MFAGKSLGTKYRADGYTPKKPVMIIPGRFFLQHNNTIRKKKGILIIMIYTKVYVHLASKLQNLPMKHGLENVFG